MIWYLLHGIMTAREPVINQDVFNVVLGALVTAFTTVVAYLFRVVAQLEQKGRRRSTVRTPDDQCRTSQAATSEPTRTTLQVDDLEARAGQTPSGPARQIR